MSCTSSQLLTGAGDRLIKIWNINTGALLYSFHGHTGKIINILFLDKNTVVSACTSKIIVWHLETGSILVELSDSYSLVCGLHRLSPTDFLSCSKSGQVCLYCLESEDFSPATWECGIITASCVFGKAKYLVTSALRMVKVWDIQTRHITCEYATASEITAIRCCEESPFIATIGSQVDLWRMTNEEVFRYWERNNVPIKTGVFIAPGKGVIEWCGKYLCCGLEVDGEFEVAVAGLDRKPEFLSHNSKILTLAPLTYNRALAFGDVTGTITIVCLETLEKLACFQETGDLSLTYLQEVPITHLVWHNMQLISASSKGTHSFYGFGGREQFISSPIQQFYSIDYLGNFTKNLTLCDLKLIPYKFQPEIPCFYSYRGFKNSPATPAQLYSYFKQQELLIGNDDLSLPLDSPRSEREPQEIPDKISEASVLEFNNDINCTRCKKMMMESTSWCSECGKVFHTDCFSTWKFALEEEELCLICFKNQINSVELKAKQRSGVSSLPSGKETPQIGDIVVFVLQGYEAYLRAFPYVPLLDKEILQYIDPTVMVVTNIEYLWPLQGPLELVAPHICMKLFLTVCGEDTTHCIYYNLLGEKFLILQNEYIFKLNLCCNSQRPLVQPSGGMEVSPWKSILQENSRISFWEAGEAAPRRTLAATEICCLSKFTKSILFIYHPNLKKYKITIPVPMYLQLIEQRLALRFYRSIAAIYFDIDLMLKNSHEFFGKQAKETKEIRRIIDDLKNEVAKCIKFPSSDENIEKLSCTGSYLEYRPWNLDTSLISVSISQTGTKRKLRKLQDSS